MTLLSCSELPNGVAELHEKIIYGYDHDLCKPALEVLRDKGYDIKFEIPSSVNGSAIAANPKKINGQASERHLSNLRPLRIAISPFRAFIKSISQYFSTPKHARGAIFVGSHAEMRGKTM
ncbi:MAG: hypothetical protein LBD25_04640 [Coriobacteriales bacterium]|jgi:hypothetical protein|nr:hypothetical protein [Coriobacteriales bacterium]